MSCFKVFLATLLFTLNAPLFSVEKKDDSYKAISSDKKVIISKASMINTLVIKNAKNHQQLKIIPVVDKMGKSSGISGMYDASTRNSFIIALRDSPEVWEINYQNPPPAGFGTWVHDYRKDSGEATVKLFPIRRLKLESPLDDFFFDEQFVNIISVSCKGKVQIIDLDLGKKVAEFNIHEKITEHHNQYKIKGLNQDFFKATHAKAIQFKLKTC